MSRRSSHRRLLEKLGTYARVPPGTVVATEGRIARQFVIVRSGRLLSVSVGSPSQTLGEGDFFGHSSLLTGEPSESTIVTSTDAELTVLDPREFSSLRFNLPDWRAAIAAKPRAA